MTTTEISLLPWRKRGPISNCDVVFQFPEVEIGACNKGAVDMDFAVGQAPPGKQGDGGFFGQRERAPESAGQLKAIVSPHRQGRQRINNLFARSGRQKANCRIEDAIPNQQSQGRQRQRRHAPTPRRPASAAAEPRPYHHCSRPRRDCSANHAAQSRKPSEVRASSVTRVKVPNFLTGCQDSSFNVLAGFRANCGQE